MYCAEWSTLESHMATLLRTTGVERIEAQIGPVTLVVYRDDSGDVSKMMLKIQPCGHYEVNARILRDVMLSLFRIPPEMKVAVADGAIPKCTLVSMLADAPLSVGPISE